MSALRSSIIVALLFGSALQAQTGDGAVETAKIAKSSNWQNWTFAGTLLVIATGAILIISMHNGSEVETTSH